MTTGQVDTLDGMTHFLAVVLDIEVGVLAAIALWGWIKSL